MSFFQKMILLISTLLYFALHYFYLFINFFNIKSYWNHYMQFSSFEKWRIRKYGLGLTILKNKDFFNTRGNTDLFIKKLIYINPLIKPSNSILPWITNAFFNKKYNTFEEYYYDKNVPEHAYVKETPTYITKGVATRVRTKYVPEEYPGLEKTQKMPVPKILTKKPWLYTYNSAERKLYKYKWSRFEYKKQNESLFLQIEALTRNKRRLELLLDNEDPEDNTEQRPLKDISKPLVMTNLLDFPYVEKNWVYDIKKQNLGISGRKIPKRYLRLSWMRDKDLRRKRRNRLKIKEKIAKSKNILKKNYDITCSLEENRANLLKTRHKFKAWHKLLSKEKYYNIKYLQAKKRSEFFKVISDKFIPYNESCKLKKIPFVGSTGDPIDLPAYANALTKTLSEFEYRTHLRTCDRILERHLIYLLKDKERYIALNQNLSLTSLKSRRLLPKYARNTFSLEKNQLPEIPRDRLRERDFYVLEEKKKKFVENLAKFYNLYDELYENKEESGSNLEEKTSIDNEKKIIHPDLLVSKVNISKLPDALSLINNANINLPALYSYLLEFSDYETNEYMDVEKLITNEGPFDSMSAMDQIKYLLKNKKSFLSSPAFSDSDDDNDIESNKEDILECATPPSFLRPQLSNLYNSDIEDIDNDIKMPSSSPAFSDLDELDMNAFDTVKDIIEDTTPPRTPVLNEVINIEWFTKNFLFPLRRKTLNQSNFFDLKVWDPDFEKNSLVKGIIGDILEEEAMTPTESEISNDLLRTFALKNFKLEDDANYKILEDNRILEDEANIRKNLEEDIIKSKKKNKFERKERLGKTISEDEAASKFNEMALYLAENRPDLISGPELQSTLLSPFSLSNINVVKNIYENIEKPKDFVYNRPDTIDRPELQSTLLFPFSLSNINVVKSIYENIEKPKEIFNKGDSLDDDDVTARLKIISKLLTPDRQDIINKLLLERNLSVKQKGLSNANIFSNKLSPVFLSKFISNFMPKETTEQKSLSNTNTFSSKPSSAFLLNFLDNSKLEETAEQKTLRNANILKIKQFSALLSNSLGDSKLKKIAEQKSLPNTNVLNIKKFSAFLSNYLGDSKPEEIAEQKTLPDTNVLNIKKPSAFLLNFLGESKPEETAEFKEKRANKISEILAQKRQIAIPEHLRDKAETIDFNRQLQSIKEVTDSESITQKQIDFLKKNLIKKPQIVIPEGLTGKKRILEYNRQLDAIRDAEESRNRIEKGDSVSECSYEDPNEALIYKKVDDDDLYDPMDITFDGQDEIEDIDAILLHRCIVSLLYDVPSLYEDFDEALVATKEATLKIPFFSTYKNKPYTEEQSLYFEYEKFFRECVLENNLISDLGLLNQFFLQKAALWHLHPAASEMWRQSRTYEEKNDDVDFVMSEDYYDNIGVYGFLRAFEANDEAVEDREHALKLLSPLLSETDYRTSKLWYNNPEFEDLKDMDGIIGLKDPEFPDDIEDEYIARQKAEIRRKADRSELIHNWKEKRKEALFEEFKKLYSESKEKRFSKYYILSEAFKKKRKNGSIDLTEAIVNFKNLENFSYINNIDFNNLNFTTLSLQKKNLFNKKKIIFFNKLLNAHYKHSNLSKLKKNYMMHRSFKNLARHNRRALSIMENLTEYKIKYIFRFILSYINVPWFSHLFLTKIYTYIYNLNFKIRYSLFVTFFENSIVMNFFDWLIKINIKILNNKFILKFWYYLSRNYKIDYSRQYLFYLHKKYTYQKNINFNKNNKIYNSIIFKFSIKLLITIITFFIFIYNFLISYIHNLILVNFCIITDFLHFLHLI